MSTVTSALAKGVASSAAAMATVDSVNPADLSDVVARVELVSAPTFVAACRAAREAQPAWAAVPAPVRGRVIAAIGRIVEENLDALARLVTREVGKPLAEARGEVQEIVDTCDFFLGEGRRLYGETVPSEMPDKQLFTGAAVRQRRGLEAGRVRGGLRKRLVRAVRRVRAARRRVAGRPG
jgi:alpha-ketoglutaric semialdehyde dehydrogenase